MVDTFFCPAPEAWLAKYEFSNFFHLFRGSQKRSFSPGLLAQVRIKNKAGKNKWWKFERLPEGIFDYNDVDPNFDFVCEVGKRLPDGEVICDVVHGLSLPVSTIKTWLEREKQEKYDGASRNCQHFCYEVAKLVAEDKGIAHPPRFEVWCSLLQDTYKKALMGTPPRGQRGVWHFCQNNEVSVKQ